MFLDFFTVKKERIICNVNRIFLICELNSEKCRVLLEDGDYYDVMSSYDDIVKRLNNFNANLLKN